MYTYFDIEQEIDKKNGGTFINSASIRKYSVISMRRNEIEVNPKMTDNMRFLKSLTYFTACSKARKKCLLASLLVITVLVASGIILPLTLYALNDTETSEVPTTIETMPTTLQPTMTSPTIPTTITETTASSPTTIPTPEKRCMYFCMTTVLPLRFTILS